MNNTKHNPHGTREWAPKNVNCCTGCSHDCRYCYARGMAVRFRQVKPEEWKEERIRWKDVRKRYRHFEGTVMFPSSHDITPQNLVACLIVLRKLLRAGNKVLVVSKPHLECIRVICRVFEDYKDQILFRFTIGASDNEILSFWEPNAPRFKERLESLRYAFGKGFNEFYAQAQSMGVEYVKGKVAKITEKEDGNLILRYEDINTGKVTETEHDMVVLSVGILPNEGITKLFTNRKLELDPFNYVSQSNPLESPAMTTIEGVFVAGVASAPMDIPDSILSAGAASSESANYIRHISKKTLEV